MSAVFMFEMTEGLRQCVPSMAVRAHDTARQFETLMESKLVQYVLGTQQLWSSCLTCHVGADKAFAFGMHMQKCIITGPVDVAALSCPQAEPTHRS